MNIIFSKLDYVNKILSLFQDCGLPEGGNDEDLTSHDNSENQVNDSKKILSQVQAFEQAAATTGKDGERARDTRKETRKEPKKLKHISFHDASSQLESIAARKKREEEIRPLGGVVRVCIQGIPT